MHQSTRTPWRDFHHTTIYIFWSQKDMGLLFLEYFNKPLDYLSHLLFYFCDYNGVLENFEFFCIHMMCIFCSRYVNLMKTMWNVCKLLHISCKQIYMICVHFSRRKWFYQVCEFSNTYYVFRIHITCENIHIHYMYILHTFHMVCISFTYIIHIMWKYTYHVKRQKSCKLFYIHHTYIYIHDTYIVHGM